MGISPPPQFDGGNLTQSGFSYHGTLARDFVGMRLNHNPA
jgi:hypothetical protein